MRILLSTFGSRGDVEPVAGLAAALQARGARAVVCAPPDPEFAALIERAGAELAPAFTEVRQWIAGAIANDPPMTLAERAAWVLEAQVEAHQQAAWDCEAVLAIGLTPSVAAARTVAEMRGLPFVAGAYCPAFLPSEHNRPLPYPGYPLPGDTTDNRALWAWHAQVTNTVFGGAINALRGRLGLRRLDDIRAHVTTERPWLAADPTLAPWPRSELQDVWQTGAWILPDHRPLPVAVEAFLAAGPPPIQVGFGSMPMAVLKAAAQEALAAARAHGRRLLLAHGWAGLDLDDAGDDWMSLGDTNQQALFPRLAAVVHHGGAGTTHTAARAGVPQVVVPQIADQPWHAARVEALGVGAAHPGPSLSAASLTAALAVALDPDVRARATALAGQMRADGADRAAEALIAIAERRTQSRS